jgi:anaerobic selenocysteine-containing dehydrogenase
MVKNGMVKTTCAICVSDCGVLAHVENGKITRIEGNPDSPTSRGTLCRKGLASLEFLNHPHRLKHPLRRSGERGGGRWERISWDEALDALADKMNKAKAEYGPESVVWLRGAAKGMQDFVFTRMVNAFGSPNITSMAYNCYHPRINGMKLTVGDIMTPDYDHPPGCIVVWGANPQATLLPAYEGIRRARAKGAKLIVIDPFETQLAKEATLWLKPRPGTDMALALGMIHGVIKEGLIDKEFIDHWTIGFDKLMPHVQAYSPEKVEQITWVSAETLREAVRLYGTNKPGVIEAGNALEQIEQALQVSRAIYILESVCGNIGVPGGEVKWVKPPLLDLTSPKFTMQDNIPKKRRERRLGAEHLAPFIYYALPQGIVKALLEEKPYMPRVVYIQGGNLLSTWGNVEETKEAFKKLEFMAANEFFMTPTAELCDIVLPAAHYLEHDAVRCMIYNYAAQVQQAVVDPGECWSEVKIYVEMAKKLGLGEHFWNDERAFLDEVLKPSHITFDEFREVGLLHGTKRYRFYQESGFSTPSRKIEIYSSFLEENGADPLPIYREPHESPYSAPGLAEEYPLILTSRKPAVFYHSNLRQIPSLRAARPDPILNIHPETAKSLGIDEGDWVYIENKQGKITHRAEFTDSLDPRVVVGDHGWWYPEKGIEDLHGFAESNMNALTSNSPPFSPEMGSPVFRGLMCKVTKAKA